MAVSAPVRPASLRPSAGRPVAAAAAGAPLVAPALAYAAGILLARYRWNPAGWWLVGAAALLAAAIYFWGRNRLRLARCLVFAALAATGAMSLELGENVANPWPANPQFAQLTAGEQTTVTAHVTRSGILEGGVPHESVDLETDSLAAADSPLAQRLRFGLRLSVYGAPAEENENENRAAPALAPLGYGQRVRFAARLKQPRNFLDPGAFDYQGFLAQQGIVALGSVRSDRIEILGGFEGTRLALWRSRVRDDLLRRIHALWPGEEGALMAAILLGDRTGVDRELTLDYQRTGAYHILVVAGLKVGILAWVLLWLFHLLRLPQWAATPLAIAGMAAYAWITEANAPVVRAAIMLAVYLVARFFYRERSPLNAVAIAALALVAWEPRALWQPSFQLTFISMLAIAGVALPLMERTSSRLRRSLRQLDSTGYDFALQPRLVEFRLDLRLLAGRLARLLGARAAQAALTLSLRAAAAAYDVVLLSAILQLALALPMALYFHRAITLGLPANALVVPLHALLLPAAALAVAVSCVSLAAAVAPAWAAHLLLHATNRVVEALAHWRIGNVFIGDLRVATPGVAACAFAVAAFLFCLWAARRRRALAAAGLALLLLSAVVLALPPPPEFHRGALEVTALDVGQGDSLLLVTPSGKSLLIDAGGELGRPGGTRFDMGEDVVSPALWARGITRLDAVALTHAHADHIGGMPAVLANFHPRELWIGPEPATLPMRRLLHQAADQQITVVGRGLGQTFDFGGCHFRVLGPPLDWHVNPEKAQNNDSLVLLVSYGATSALLEGDAEKKVERELAEEDPAADLLKVGHHGSSSSTTPELLAAAHPRYAVISVGFRSPFRHPRPEVLQRLEAAGARTFRTDTMGATTFLLDGKSVRARAFTEMGKYPPPP